MRIKISYRVENINTRKDVMNKENVRSGLNNS